LTVNGFLEKRRLANFIQKTSSLRKKAKGAERMRGDDNQQESMFSYVIQKR
jgi:hypothetical protein